MKFIIVFSYFFLYFSLLHPQDSSYQDWYDEAAHPVPTQARPSSTNIDAAFDAVFGGAGDGGDVDDHLSFASSLPQTILQTAMLSPWQAALAASLQLAHSTAAAAVTAAPTAAVKIFSRLVPSEQRKASAAAVLKVIDPNHSRNAWLAASKGADALPVSGTLLHIVFQLKSLLGRTSRRTAPPTLSSYLSLARCLLPVAHAEDAASIAAARESTAGRACWRPLQAIGPLVHSFSCYPPLLGASINVDSACALPQLAAAGYAPLEAAAYSAAVLWLTVQSKMKAGGGGGGVNNIPPQRPEWISYLIPESTVHPLVTATPAARGMAAKELMLHLSSTPSGDDDGGNGSGGGIIIDAVVAAAGVALLEELRVDDAVEDENEYRSARRAALLTLPVMDACAAVALCLHREYDDQTVSNVTTAEAAAVGTTAADPLKRENSTTEPPQLPTSQPAVILLGLMDDVDFQSSFMKIAATLCSMCADSAQLLASIFDSPPKSISKKVLYEIEARCSLLGLGVDLIDVLQQLPPPLSVIVTPSSNRTTSDAGPRSDFSAAFENATAAQSTCLELLRTLPETSKVYAAAVKGLDAAPVLALPLAVGQEEEQEHDDDSSDGEGDLTTKGTHLVPQEQSSRSAWHRNKRLKDIKNPYLRVIVAESRRTMGEAADGELSDLEDFIVANPERDYGHFIENHFPMAAESDEDGGGREEEEDEEESDDGGGGE